MKLIDTNIWVHALSRDSPKKERAQDTTNILMGLGEAAISTQTLLELYAAMTKTLPPAVSAKWSEKFAKSRNIIKFEPTLADTEVAIELARKQGLRRSEIFDALLAATALRNGVKTILTENVRHFEKLGMKVETL